MHFTVAAIDWDGTLAGEDRVVSGRTKQAIVDFRRRGGTVLIISGRPVAGIRHASEKYGLDLTDTILVGMNGGEAYRADGDELFFAPIPVPVTAEVLQKAADFDVMPMLVKGSQVFTSDPTHPAAVEEAYENGLEAVRVDDLIELELAPAKLVIGGHPEVPREWAEQIKAPFTDVIEASFSEPQFFEITAKGVSKGETLTRLAETLGFELARTVAFGDSFNDLAMIRAAGRGYAMANAIPELKDVADEIAPANTEDGVAQVLDTLLR